MIATRISISADTASHALAEKLRRCDPATIATRIKFPLAEYWRCHLAHMPHNRMGYPATGFWEQAADSVVGLSQGSTATIQADKLGLAQRYYGGTITARNVQNITIPICAEAYGTTVADWGFDNLVLVVLSDGRKFLALWLGSDAAQSAYHEHLGRMEKAYDPDATEAQRKAAQNRLWKTAGTTAARVGKVRASLGVDSKKPNVIVFRGAGSGSGGMQVSRAARHANLKFLFVLKHSVEQASNPNVIPPDFGERAVEEIDKATRL